MLFQSTPPRKRRRRYLCVAESLDTVSIHASAQEATAEILQAFAREEVSIHASAQEATPARRV